MHAQPQSILAARIPSPPSLLPSPATLPLKTPSALIPTPSALIPKPAALLSTLPATSRPTASLAETSGLAHDAGNLLAALGLYCDLLKVPGVLRPEHRHYATELCLISNRSAELIRRLLGTPIARIPCPTQPGNAPTFLPPKLFRRRNERRSDILATTSNPAVTLLSLAPVLGRIAAGAATVIVTCPTSLPPLDFSSEIIERITVNLVRNAAEAIRLQQANAAPILLAPSGEIRVTLAVIAGLLQLTVEDNGPGMSPTHVEAYIHPEPLPLGASRGLGHLIVHELVTDSGGQLAISVRPGQGTSFCLKWPLHFPLPAEPCPPDVP